MSISICFGLYEKAMPHNIDWEQKLTITKECGYDFLEMSIDESDEKLMRLNWTNDDCLKLIKAMQKTKIPIGSICLSAHRKYPLGSHEPAIIKKSLDIMQKALNLATSLGVRIIMLAGYDVYYEKSDLGTKKRFFENLKHCVDMAAQKGILLAFETMETEFMDTVQKAMNYIVRIGSPYLTVYPDIGNVTNAAKKYNHSVFDDLKKSQGHIVALHLKESSPGIYRNMMFGEGHVDFETTIKTALALGVRRFVTEFWYLGEKDWKKRIIFVRSFFNSLF